MKRDLDLWSSLDEILQVYLNPIDRTGVGKLNRLARNGFEEIKAIGFELSPDNSSIELIENITLTSLGDYRLAHNKTGARAYTNPLIMINWDNTNFIVDGTHRINGWVANNFSGTFSVIKITPDK